MRGFLRYAAILAVLTLTLTGCEAIKGLFNPFQGKWKSGILELEFESGSSFNFRVGSTISLNLSGEYSYDENKLVLKFNGGSDVTFSYRFSDEEKNLTLVPETDFEYIKTQIQFKKE
jgi:hypothetical protein